MASVMLPLFLPAGVTIDKLLRAQIALILFAAAYLAEVVRGGLQAIPQQPVRGGRRARPDLLAAHAARDPAAGAAHRDAAAGEHLHRLLQGHLARADHRAVRSPRPRVKVSLNEPAWTGFGVEAYLFAALVYFAFCYAMSLYSRGLERKL